MATLPSVDVVIVGGGWTGLLMAQEITTRTSLKVVVLERGPDRNIFNYMDGMDEVDHSRRLKMMQNPADETVTHRHTPANRAVPIRQYGSFMPGTGTGGAGEHWTGYAYRYTPETFNLESHIKERYSASQLPEGLDVRDFGFTWSDIEPDYYRAEQLIGVGGTAGNVQGRLNRDGNIFEGERSKEYPLPAHKLSYAMTVVEKAAKELGWNPHRGPVATLTDAYTNPHGVSRPACQYCGYCSRYGCMVGAKGQPTNVLMPVLQKQSNFELRNNAWVRRVIHEGGQARGVTYMNEAGEETTQPADIVVLCGFTVPNVRLLMLSKIGTPYDPATGRGSLGRRFTHQTGKPLGGPRVVFNEPLRLFMGAGGNTIRMADFDRDRASEETGQFLRFGSFGYGAGGQTPIGGFGGAPMPDGMRRWGSEWKKHQLDNHDRVISAGGDAEHMSYRQNFLDLDPTYTDKWGDPLLRMTMDFTEHEVRQSQFMAKVCRELLQEVASQGQAEFVDGEARHQQHYSAARYQATHIHGGTPMGTSRSDSVLNPYLQHWDLPNMWVVGASSFPVGGAPNPTMTVLAVAYRAADALIDRYLKRPGLVG